jgi:putative transposase
MALKNRVYLNRQLIHHSDSALQYCSNKYLKILNNKKLRCSMTASYDPYQHAVAERINGILKQAFLMNTKNVDLKTIKKTVKQRVHIYTKLRPHWSIYKRTINQMHKQNSIKISTYKTKISEH